MMPSRTVSEPAFSSHSASTLSRESFVIHSDEGLVPTSSTAGTARAVVVVVIVAVVVVVMVGVVVAATVIVVDW